MMNRKVIVIVISLIPAIISVHFLSYAQQFDSLLVKSQSLLKEHRYAEAIDVIESTFIHKDIKYNYRYNLFNTSEYLAMLYRHTGQLDRGAKVLYKIHLSDPKRYGLDDALFDLSLESRNYEIAKEVISHQGFFPTIDLNYARLFAAQGIRDSALTALMRYLKYEYGESRNRILTHREFVNLYSDETFQKLMTDPNDWLQRKRNRHKEYDTPSISSVTQDSISQAAENYKLITDSRSVKQYREQLEKSDHIMDIALPKHKEYILNLLKSEKKSTYYRITLAQFLASLNDSIMTSRLAKEIANDNFLNYPNQIFHLAYSIAQSNPADAKSLLYQMLQISQGEIFIPEHAMSLDWTGMLMQAFGVAESYYLPELKKWSNDDNSTISSNATLLLVFFGEPDVIQVLMSKISSQKSFAVRDSLIKLIAIMRLPQSVTALKTLRQEAILKDLSDTLESRLMAKIVPPESLDAESATDAIRIDNSIMKSIFLNNLYFTCGSDVSFMPKTILLSVNKSDIQTLRKIRSNIMRRMSDEAIYDYQTISSIINYLQWQ